MPPYYAGAPDPGATPTGTPLHRDLMEHMGTEGFATTEDDASLFVADPVRMELNDLNLRPGTHRRFSFRATPGSKVDVSLNARAWLSLAELDDPQPPTTAPGPTPGPSDGPGAHPGGQVLTPVDELVFTRATSGKGQQGVTGPAAVSAALRRNVRGPGRLSPHDDEVFDPVDPVPLPKLPVEVIVTTRSGEELGRGTLNHTGARPSLVVDTDTDDVVDVTFVNHNDVAVICYFCSVLVTRRIRTTTTTLESDLFLRAFNGAISSLSPTFTLDAGMARVTFHGDIADEFDLPAVEYDLGVAFDGGATFEPTDLQIMGLSEMIRIVLRRFQRDALTVLKNWPSAQPGDKDALKDLTSVMADHLTEKVSTAAFVESVATEYFTAAYNVSRPRNVEQEILRLARPPGLSWGQEATLQGRVRGLLQRYPILTDSKNTHRPADPAIVASYGLSEIHGRLGFIRLEMDRFEATGFLALHASTSQIPAPYGDLPEDKLTVGALRPTFQLDVEIGPVDVDITVPSYLGILVPALKLGEFLVEQGGADLLNFMLNKAERAIPEIVHSFVTSHAAAYGDKVVETMKEIVDRDREFRGIAADRTHVAIGMVDPRQLQVPHDPHYWLRPSPVEGIEETLPPIRPIDADPLDRPSVGLSPNQRLQRISHLVFIMMENRSFDHMLGYLSHPQYGRRTDVDGLDGRAQALGGDFSGTHATPVPGPSPSFRPNLRHDHQSIVRQINGGAMNGFVSEYARKLDSSEQVSPWMFLADPERVLRFHTPEVVGFYDVLAREYAICDRWFSSLPAGTYPNRACYYTGVAPALGNAEIQDLFGYVPDVTVFDILDHVDVDWRVYESDITFLRVYDRFRLEQKRIRPIEELTELSDLPPVTFIDPNFTGFPRGENNDDQPPTDVRNGQEFLEGVINKIKKMDHWDSTMIVIMYDEHGGFADHVPPPGAPGSSHPPVDGAPSIPLSHADASTYGVRVPAFVVSPHVTRGTVAHNIFDHAAVFKTVLQRFAPQHINSKILPERVRWSRHLGEVLSPGNPVNFAETPPSSPKMMASTTTSSAGRITLEDEMESDDLGYALDQLGRPIGRRVPRVGDRWA